MALDHSLVGLSGEPYERSWTSTDALLYAIAVGAGLGDPLRELEFTTENSSGIEQQVLPTFGVLVAQARPGRTLGTFDRARLVHAKADAFSDGRMGFGAEIETFIEPEKPKMLRSDVPRPNVAIPAGITKPIPKL